jgi:hypothetical protein
MKCKDVNTQRFKSFSGPGIPNLDNYLEKETTYPTLPLWMYDDDLKDIY